VAVKIKSGSTLSTESWKGLDHLARRAGPRGGPRFLVYRGDESHEIRGIGALSWKDLGPLRAPIGA